MRYSGYFNSVDLVNNTIYQPTGDAILVTGSVTNAHLRNNILWTQNGFDISVDNSSQSGFTSDYNLLYTSGAGKVASWQGVSRPVTGGSSLLVGRTGQPAPGFSLPGLSSPAHHVTLASLRGRPLLVNFWASWCVPCRTEMPLLERTYRSESGTT